MCVYIYIYICISIYVYITLSFSIYTSRMYNPLHVQLTRTRAPDPNQIGSAAAETSMSLPLVFDVRNAQSCQCVGVGASISGWFIYG